MRTQSSTRDSIPSGTKLGDQKVIPAARSPQHLRAPYIFTGDGPGSPAGQPPPRNLERQRPVPSTAVTCSVPSPGSTLPPLPFPAPGSSCPCGSGIQSGGHWKEALNWPVPRGDVPLCGLRPLPLRHRPLKSLSGHPLPWCQAGR